MEGEARTERRLPRWLCPGDRLGRWTSALLAALPPAALLFIVRGGDLPFATADWFALALQYGLTLLFHRLIERPGRTWTIFAALMAGRLASGLLLWLLAFTPLACFAPWQPAARWLFELTEAAVIGWCLWAAVTAWERSWLAPLLGVTLGAVVSGIAAAWLPLADGALMAGWWALRLLVLYAPLAVLLHLASPSPTKDGSDDETA